MKRQIILDTETTGLLTSDGHRLIEVGCLEMINRRFTGQHFHRYINPQRPVDPGAFAVHGLSDDFLKDKPLFATIVTELLDFIADAELVIHNAPFDIGFLNYELKLWDKNHARIDERCAVLDTLILARQKHPGQSNSLDALCKRYQVDNSNRDLHGALIDAQLLGQVYLMMTGGQDELFAAHDSAEPVLSHATVNANTTAVLQQRRSLPVIQPTADELEAHQQFLATLKKSGRCVWDVA